MKPGQIAVVFRHPQPLADLVSEVFQRLEILSSWRAADRCGRSPAIMMLLRLLELDADDWPMHKLLGVLGNNYFDPDWADWNDPHCRPGRAHDPRVCKSPAAASGCWSS